MRKVWNRAALPVWSLVTRDDAGVPNMNICTYVSAVSMKPKLMMVAVYHGTKTRANIRLGETVALQLLASEQAPLLRLLGHTSGYQGNKITRLQKRHPIAWWAELPYLTAAAGCVWGTVTQIVPLSGDHYVVILAVSKQKSGKGTTPLTTEILRDRGLLR